MSTHRLLKQFNPDLRDLNILHDHSDPSVKYEFLFSITIYLKYYQSIRLPRWTIIAPLIVLSIARSQYIPQSTILDFIELTVSAVFWPYTTHSLETGVAKKTNELNSKIS